MGGANPVVRSTMDTTRGATMDTTRGGTTGGQTP